MTTLTSSQTIFFLAARQENFWDFFSTVSGISQPQYNSYVDDFNNWNDDADGQLLKGTRDDSSTFYISGMPNRKRPIHK